MQDIELQNNGYKSFLHEIVDLVQHTRHAMMENVSRQTVMLYWNIGKRVSRKMKADGWGKSVVEKLASDLQREFQGVRGFSARNVWRMKTFYEFYNSATAVAENSAILSAAVVAEIPIGCVSDDYISAPTGSEFPISTENNYEIIPDINSAAAVAELQNPLFQLVIDIGWTQNCIILEKCKDINKIVFYLKQTKEKGWSKLDLLDKIEKNWFENHALSQNNFEQTVTSSLKAQVAWEFLDDYNIELLNPDQPVAEKTLENSIVSNIETFLHNMGGNFAFVGRQYRLELEGSEYFVDLLFFNIKLNCYVAFELKAREFSAKDFGQLQLYMQLINKYVKQPFHNPTIGIIICRKKNRLEVDYMLEMAMNPMGVATFNSYKNLPEEYAKYLPSENQLLQQLTIN